MYVCVCVRVSRYLRARRVLPVRPADAGAERVDAQPGAAQRHLLFNVSNFAMTDYIFLLRCFLVYFKT